MSKTNEEIVEELKPKVTLRSEDRVQWDKASHILQSALDAWYKDFEPALRTTLEAKDKECEERVREEAERVIAILCPDGVTYEQIVALNTPTLDKTTEV